jgi:hypothetical protein
MRYLGMSWKKKRNRRRRGRSRNCDRRDCELLKCQDPVHSPGTQHLHLPLLQGATQDEELKVDYLGCSEGEVNGWPMFK